MSQHVKFDTAGYCLRRAPGAASVAAANAERVMLVCANLSSQPIQLEIASDGTAVVVRNRAMAIADYFPLINSAPAMADVLAEELRRQGYRCRRVASDDAGPG